MAQVAECGEHPDHVEHKRQLKWMSKRIMKRRELTVKNLDFEQATRSMAGSDSLSERREARQGQILHRVLGVGWVLEEQGLGRRGRQHHGHYESKDERKFLKAVSAAGVHIASVEAAPIEPDSSLPHEQEIMHSREALFIQDDFVYEGGPQMSTEELKKRFSM